jgi:hypothetical protein
LGRVGCLAMLAHVSPPACELALAATLAPGTLNVGAFSFALTSAEAPLLLAALPPSMGRSPPAPTGPRVIWPEPPPVLDLPTPRGERARPHRKQSRRREKLGANWQLLQVQSPGCGGRLDPPAPPRPPALASRELPPLASNSRPREPPRAPPAAPRASSRSLWAARSTCLSRSRRPCRRTESVPPPLSLPPPPPRRCGMMAAAMPPPPPPWCAARRRCAAPRATSARADWRRRRARRCHACSPRAVAASWRPSGGRAADRRGHRRAAARRGSRRRTGAAGRRRCERRRSGRGDAASRGGPRSPMQGGSGRAKKHTAERRAAARRRQRRRADAGRAECWSAPGTNGQSSPCQAGGTLPSHYTHRPIRL